MVAQVMNRVFSFYRTMSVGSFIRTPTEPASIHLRLWSIPDIVTEPDAWERAKRISRDILDGKLWMPEVSKSTHYHAYWVRPDWVNEMKKIYKLGVHTFYRPRAWGEGDDEPTWGDAATTEKEAAAEEAKGPVSHSAEWLKSRRARRLGKNAQIVPGRASAWRNALDHEYSFGAAPFYGSAPARAGVSECRCLRLLKNQSPSIGGRPLLSSPAAA